MSSGGFPTASVRDDAADSADAQEILVTMRDALHRVRGLPTLNYQR